MLTARDIASADLVLIASRHPGLSRKSASLGRPIRQVSLGPVLLDANAVLKSRRPWP